MGCPGGIAGCGSKWAASPTWASPNSGVVPPWSLLAAAPPGAVKAGMPSAGWPRGAGYDPQAEPACASAGAVAMVTRL
jgi:hypothetical protein